MTAAAILLFLAIIGVSVATLVIRADARRYDSRLFAAIILVDAAMAFGRFVGLLSGSPMDDEGVLRALTPAAVALAHLSVEFAWSFPRNTPLPWRLRAPLLVVGLAAVAYCAGPFEMIHGVVSYGYFMPVFSMIIAFQWRNFRTVAREDRRAISLVLAAFIFRWACAMITFTVGVPAGPETFRTLLFIEATVAPLVGFLIMGGAILRSQLFSVRGAAAEGLLLAGAAVAVVGLTSLAVEGVLRLTEGNVQRALLVAAALVPAGAIALGRRVHNRVEDALASWDPRRALRREVLARVAADDAADPEAIWRGVQAALGDVTQGGRATLLTGAALEALDLPAGERHVVRRRELIVPVRAQKQLFGAIRVEGGTLDRDTLLAAVSLADHLALRLENHALFAELEESRRLAVLGSFAAAIAHDLRTPLTSVQLNVQILRGKAAALGAPADDMEYFDIALAELRRVNVHIAELLDYAKPVRLQASPLDVREVVDEAARGLSPLLGERRLALSREHEEGLPQVLVDAARMRQVLMNLVENAAKASPDGGAITVRTRKADGAHRIAVDVCDRGVGISADDLPRIFEPFFTTRPDGTGLGLAICQKLVRAHAGEIQVKSVPGEGSTFTVLLPAAG